MGRVRQHTRGGFTAASAFQGGRGGSGPRGGRGGAPRGSVAPRGSGSRGGSRGGYVFSAVHLGQLTPDQTESTTPNDTQSQLRNIAYDSSYDTCFYSHTFNQGTFGEHPAEIDNTFLPKFSLFQTNTNVLHPEAAQTPTYWLGVNFTSRLDGAGLTSATRPGLNLVLALDVSGSMGESLTSAKSKIALAKECILSVTAQLRDDDFFGLVVFNTEASVITPLTKWGNIDQIELCKTTNRLKPGGGTSLESGLSKACELLKSAPEGENRSSRICFLTDMEATNSTDEPAFLLKVKTYSDEAFYTTIIGVGVDLTRESVVETSRTPGCNYCNVYSDEQFRDMMNKEFNYFVSPIAFNVQLDIINQSQWKFYKAFGSAELTKVPLDLVRFSSEFPSSMDEHGKARAGAYIFSLTPCGERTQEEPLPDIVLKVKWEDSQGITRTITQNLPFDLQRCFGLDSQTSVSPACCGIRKSVLLIHFVDFIQAQVNQYNDFVNKCREKQNNPELELPSPPSATLIQSFIDYYTSEKIILQDETLQGELDILKNLLSVVASLPTIQ